jgi:hypothetical protein
MSKRLTVITVGALAIALASCTTTTAPVNKTRTTSVSTTAAIPATPTAPITLQTNDPQSNVQATLPVASLQAMASLVGGAAQLKMTDLASTNYSTLPTGAQAAVEQFGVQTMATIVLDLSKSTALASASASRSVFRSNTAVGIGMAAANSIGSVGLSFINTSGRTCSAGPINIYDVTSGTSILIGAGSIDASGRITANFNLTFYNYSGTFNFVSVNNLTCPRLTGAFTGAP